jgi:hypothetical protein
MNLEMEKCVNFNIIYMFFFEKSLDLDCKKNFHLPFLVECTVHLPYNIKWTFILTLVWTPHMPENTPL